VPFIGKIRSFLHNVIFHSHVDTDLEAEIRAHLEMVKEEHVRKGMTSGEAERAERIELGGLEQLKEQVREQRVGNLFCSVLADCRFALRQLGKSPTFTLAAVLTLALGIGATTAIFSFADLLLDHPVALQSLNYLVSVDETNTDGQEVPLLLSNFRDIRAGASSLQDFAGYQEWTASLLGANGAQESNGARVDQEVFNTVEAKPIFGRPFFRDEYALGKNHVVLISHALWQREFAGDPRVTTKTLRLDEENYSVVGVMSANFQFPPGDTQFWVPLSPNHTESDRVHGTISTVGLLKPGTTLPQARAELNTVWNRLQQQFPEANRAWQLSVVSLRDRLVDEDSRQFAVLFLCVAGFVFLIACVNVANLQLARAASRERELSVRIAVGAGRARLIRQLLTESLVLAVIGGAAGLFLAFWGVAVMRANLPAQVRENLRCVWHAGKSPRFRVHSVRGYHSGSIVGDNSCL
jgi:predicted permease